MSRQVLARKLELIAAGMSDEDAEVVATGERYQMLVTRDGFAKTARQYDANVITDTIKAMNAIKTSS